MTTDQTPMAAAHQAWEKTSPNVYCSAWCPNADRVEKAFAAGWTAAMTQQLQIITESVSVVPTKSGLKVTLPITYIEVEL